MILSITFFGAISITDTAMNFAKYDGSSKGGCRSSNLSFSLFLLTVLFAASAIKAGSRPLEGAPLDKCVCVREIYSLTPQPGCPMLMWHGSRRLQTPTDLITVCVQTFITVAWTYHVCKFTVHTRSANYTAWGSGLYTGSHSETSLYTGSHSETYHRQFLTSVPCAYESSLRATAFLSLLRLLSSWMKVLHGSNKRLLINY